MLSSAIATCRKGLGGQDEDEAIGAGRVVRGASGRPRWLSKAEVSVQHCVSSAASSILSTFSPSPSVSITTSQRKALRVIFNPVCLSVDRVELLRSIALGGSGGGRDEVGRPLVMAVNLYGEEARVGITPVRDWWWCQASLEDRGYCLVAAQSMRFPRNEDFLLKEVVEATDETVGRGLSDHDVLDTPKESIQVICALRNHSPRRIRRCVG